MRERLRPRGASLPWKPVPLVARSYEPRSGDEAMHESRDHRPIRVVIIDDHPMVREMIQLRLERAGGIEVVGAAGDGAAGLDLIREHRPDILILDLALPGMSGLEVARRVRASFPEVAVLVLTGYYSPWHPRTLLQLGVRAYLPKTVSGEEFVAAVRAVAQGRTVLVARMTGVAQENGAEHFTAREREVLRLMAAGLHNREIAAEMSVTEKTVEFHVHRVLAKLHAHSRTQAILKAQQLGLILSDPSDKRGT